MEQIAYALDHPWYEGPVEVHENKYIVLGFDCQGIDVYFLGEALRI